MITAFIDPNAEEVAESEDVNLGKEDDEVANDAEDEDEDEDEDGDNDSDSDDDKSIDPELPIDMRRLISLTCSIVSPVSTSICCSFCKLRCTSSSIPASFSDQGLFIARAAARDGT